MRAPSLLGWRARGVPLRRPLLSLQQPVFENEEVVIEQLSNICSTLRAADRTGETLVLTFVRIYQVCTIASACCPLMFDEITNDRRGPAAGVDQ
jgi:hypothetical protein